MDKIYFKKGKIINSNFKIDPDKLYIVAEVADLLRVSPETIRRRARENNIGYIKQGRRGDYYFLGIDIIEYLRKYHFKPEQYFNKEVKNDQRL